MAERLSTREISRRAIRHKIESVAMELFLEKGFDATTVDQIAAEAGISARSFFRYFPTKEDVVTGDPVEYGVVLRDALESRPTGEDAATAVRGALAEFIGSVAANPAALGISTIMLKTPSLWAKHQEKQRVWVELLQPETVRRLGGAPHPDLLAGAILESALATFHASLMHWASRDGDDDLHELFRLASSATRGAPLST
ncbi:TetR family transcriptional regulator [Saccharopolyspora sp. NFXS83]|uniref:TetR family transcriptional regulator n=1 Tax=Saccharopolyspora sp. NFXS83 TaxID=2993560 RepID=UPI00224AFE83|nr:TetR family transcriptional regulator [Saccharopolyspora sp. NFXS83]MCX2732980.1 TetR family transcriptional regulator [Saccharopolyspora sp. NFXS83]